MPYSHITTNTSTGIKAHSQGMNYTKLNRVVVNKAGAAANTATIYDGDVATGDVVAVIDTTVAGTKEFGKLLLSKGLSVVTATGTAGDLTVVYDE